MRRVCLYLLGLLISLFSLSAMATDISVVGVFPGKAVLVVDQKRPKTYSAGSQVAPGIKLVSVSRDSAVLQINGKRERIAMGQHVGTASHSNSGTVTLQADGRGHFVTHGQINGGMVRMLVDTGATMVSMPAVEAQRLGINYKRGRVIHVRTANGVTMGYLVKLDSVKVGDITLYQVNGLVQESGLPVTLLGMSFLNRTKMSRDGNAMTLEKRF